MVLSAEFCDRYGIVDVPTRRSDFQSVGKDTGNLSQVSGTLILDEKSQQSLGGVSIDAASVNAMTKTATNMRAADFSVESTRPSPSKSNKVVRQRRQLCGRRRSDRQRIVRKSVKFLHVVHYRTPFSPVNVVGVGRLTINRH